MSHFSPIKLFVFGIALSSAVHAQAHEISLGYGYSFRAGPGTNYRSFNTSRGGKARLDRYSPDGRWARVILGNGNVAWISARGISGRNKPSPSIASVAPSKAPVSPVPQSQPDQSSPPAPQISSSPTTPTPATPAPNLPVADATSPTTPQVPATPQPALNSKVTIDGSSNGDKIKQNYGAMRYDPVAASGACTLQQIKTDAAAKALLDIYGIKTPGASAQERINLANGVFQVSALYGGKFPPFVGLKVMFAAKTGFSHAYGSDGILDLNICDKGGGSCGAASNINVARLMHEAGHAAYRYAIPFKNCSITAYSHGHYAKNGSFVVGLPVDPVENAAEIFAAFVTRPTLLSQGSLACQEAYNYYVNTVFKANGKYSSCNTSDKQELLANIQGIDPSSNITTVSFEHAFSPPQVEIRSAALPTPAGDPVVNGSANAPTAL